MGMVAAGVALSVTLEGLQASPGLAVTAGPGAAETPATAPAAGSGADPAWRGGPAPLPACGDDAAFRRRDWQDLDQGAAAEARAIAQAATWQVDPALTEVLPTDSARTVAARVQLADLTARVRDGLAAYDAARAQALVLTGRARAAREDLAGARERLRAARRSYRADRDVLVSLLTQNYTMTQLAPVAAALTGGDDAVPADLTRLEEMGRTQAGVVQRSERSRARLTDAERTYAGLASQADAELCAARAATATALQARDRVVADFVLARTAVTRSALADAREALLAASGPAGSTTDGAGLDATDPGVAGWVPLEPGAVVFPLAPGTPFVDQDNFGGRSGLWASTHTGDDLSAACGSTVVAATDGTVLIRTDQGWSGRWLVMVTTGAGSLTTWYAHLQQVDVADGDQVQAGQPIGQVGQEGNATGCHLHFEVHPSGGSIYQDDTDPASWLRAVGAYPGAG